MTAVTTVTPVTDVVLAAVPTPFTADGSLDTDAARRLYRFAADGVDGLFVAGTTGEFPSLDDDERLALVEIGLEAAGPERVIAHIGAPDAHRAARLAAAAVGLGAVRIAAITPYYLAPLPGEVTAYFERIRLAAPSARLYSYIFPERTGLTVQPDQFAALAESVGLAGAKFSGSAARNVAACAAACPGLKIFSGDDSDLAATLRAGGAGIISARSSAFPEVFRALSAALAAGDADAAARHQADAAAIAGVCKSIGQIKEALRLRGFGPMHARMPVNAPRSDSDSGSGSGGGDAVADRIAELVRALAPAVA